MLAGAGDGTERWLEVACYPERGTTSSRADLVAVFAIDVTQAMERRRELERTTTEREEHIRAIEARVGQLTTREKALLQANDELTLVNGDLRNGNEQLQIKVEESASASEEVEMLNEELQATESERTLKSAIDSLLLSVAVLDAGGAVVHASPAIAAWAAAAADRWWEHGARIDVDGRAYSVSTQPPDTTDKHDTLVIPREST